MVHRVDRHAECLDRDDKRIGDLEESNRLIMRGVMQLMSHEIDGNHVASCAMRATPWSNTSSASNVGRNRWASIGKCDSRNKAFWLAFVPAVLLFAQVLAAPFGYRWDFAVLNEQMAAIINAVFSLLALLGVVADPDDGRPR